MGPTLSIIDMVLRLGAATLFGALIGLERERLDRAAGLRTHALVSVASALIMIVSAFGFSDTFGPERLVSLDPSRMAAQVVSGIGFLGAGVIFLRKNTVRGLTTAASVWSVAGIGLATGGGLFLVAAIGTAFILLVQAGLRPIEHHFFVRDQEHRLALRVRRGASRLSTVEQIISARGVKLRGLRLRPARGGAEDRVELSLGAAREGMMSTVLEALREIDGVRVVQYTRGTTHLLPGTNMDEADEVDDPDLPDDSLTGTGDSPRFR